MDPTAILARLTVNAVLLPIRQGTKSPARREWSSITFKQTQSDEYQKSLRKAPAIGVLLGQGSEALCSIDFDDDAFLDVFLSLNPDLEGTLRTKANRGSNLWMIFTDPFPKTKKLVWHGTPVGEFRSCGSQTLIEGEHPDGRHYRRIVDAPPKRVPYGSVVWPEGVAAPATPSHFSQLSPCSPSLHPLDTLRTLDTLYTPSPSSCIKRISAGAEAEARLFQNKPLHRLYRDYVDKKFTPRQGRRNTDLIAMMTFLFYAVGRKRALELAQVFYDVNQGLFVDSGIQHMREAEAHYAKCEEQWLKVLPDDIAQTLALLPTVHREAFRIFHDLASQDRLDSPKGFFFISCNNLAGRLGIHSPGAQKILAEFEAAGFLQTLVKGTKQDRKATRFKWLPAGRAPA